MKKLILFFSFLGLLGLWQPSTIQAKTAEELYVQPIPGLEEGLFGIGVQTMAKSLINDNYQVYCAAPAEQIGPEVLGKYKRYLELYYGQEDTKILETIVSDPGGLENPLVLDDTKTDDNSGMSYKQKNTSAIEYGFRSKPEPEVENPEVITAPYYRQLTVKQQCELSQDVRQEVMARCQQLKKTPLSECPANIDIPGMNGIQIADIKINCNIFDNPYPEKFIEPWLLQGMANMPYLNANNIKRPAWLVICFEQMSGIGELFEGRGTVPSKKAYQESLWSAINGPRPLARRDECSVRTILVDRAFTETNPYLTNYSIDAHDLPKQALMTADAQATEEAKFKKARSARREMTLSELADGHNPDDRVYINYEDDFKTVLIEMINGTAPACATKTIRQEDSPTIGSEADLAPGGAEYEKSNADAFSTWTRGGKLASLMTKLKGEFITGRRTAATFESRRINVESFIIAPYSNENEKISLESFFINADEYEKIKHFSEEIWPTHVNYEGGLVGSSTNTEKQDFEDYEDWEWKTFYDEYGHSYLEKVYKQKEFGLTISDLGQQISTRISNLIRDSFRPILGLLNTNSPAHEHSLNTLGNIEDPSRQPNLEEFLKGDGTGLPDDDDDGGIAYGSCQEYTDAGGKVELPDSISALQDMICDVAGGNQQDAQLLYGLMKIEATPLLDTIAGFNPIDGSPLVATCADLIQNSCGASEITGQLVPQCIDPRNCPQAADIAQDMDDPWIQEIRNNEEVGCDIRTQLEYTLRKRKSEKTYLTQNFTTQNGRAPTTQELYYMMAGRNYGVPKDYLFQPACGDYEAVDGCNGNNYCTCTMDQFPISCN